MHAGSFLFWAPLHDVSAGQIEPMNYLIKSLHKGWLHAKRKILYLMQGGLKHRVLERRV